MRVYLLLFFSIACFGQLLAQPTDSLFMQAAVQKLQHAKTYTLQVATAMPETEYGFKPTAAEMSFAEQLLHLADNLAWLTASYLQKDSVPHFSAKQAVGVKDSVMSVVAQTYDYALFVLQHFKTQQLGEKVDFFAGPTTKLQIINLINDHQTHHRAQMLVYLRLKNIEPPAYVGW